MAYRYVVALVNTSNHTATVLESVIVDRAELRETLDAAQRALEQTVWLRVDVTPILSATVTRFLADVTREGNANRAEIEARMARLHSIAIPPRRIGVGVQADHWTGD